MSREQAAGESLASVTGMLSAVPAAGTAKIAIAGARHVGVTLAYACLIRGTGKTIALYGRNVAICRDLLPRLLEVAPGAVLVIVTSPVDVVTYAALKIGGLPRRRVLGSGTVLDSSRLRSLIARRCGVAVQNVHAYIAGEHGDSEIPLWTSATVGGVPFLRWEDAGRPPVTAAEEDDLRRQVVQAGYQVPHGKGYTNYAIALATARIIEAVLYDEHQVLPVSSLLTGYAGISDVCLSVPSVIGRAGLLRVLPVPLSGHEREGLQRSARTVRAVLDQLGL
jgi:L-lactate dehydrogenase